jgi:undecaprenyl-diphosphatase
MDILQALVYGIIQGITEFLPISSDAHLIIIPKLLGWQEPSLDFDIALHLGTTAAVIAFFFKDWVALIKAGFTKPASENGKIFWWIILATIPGGVIGLLINKYAEAVRNLTLISSMLIVMGLLLYFVDKYASKAIDIKKIGALNSVLIGASQVIAMIPGVSRSGITITAGRFLGVKRESAAKFTFLLSTPTMLGLGLYKLKDISNVPVHPLTFSIAILSSAIVGVLSIKFLLDYIKKKGFGIFAGYRCVLGIILLLLLLTKVVR